ncbi:hypothetical protein HYH02_013986 [Chlamydomonas schloesseri]|uniref:ABC transporter domain-containing protein n=1 Tax=Chlamydomonas schloesseri TaxID=2026947 RepID=A0A835SMH3_9CHLO|nr:hypothetical protein HYH02_013986 [Chlamydomonas schloesseri]|eukprot:KAG2429729.1 hypothetical protein HYH02_013986 [Chlamydomonas schloesseri]
MIQNDCAASQFCSHPPLSRLPGTCEGCWKCCLFPRVFGTTACSRCRCSLSNTCYSDGECGAAEFCAVLTSRRDLPTCRSCAFCRNDTQSWRGSCAAACPSGALAANEVAGDAAGHYLFAAFSLAGDEAARQAMAVEDSGLVTITEAGLRSWLSRYGLPGEVVGVIMGGLPHVHVGENTVLAAAAAGSLTVDPPQAADRVALAAFAARLSAVAPARDALCPQPPAGGGTSGMEPASPPAVRVSTGCPCNATAGAASFRCAAGLRCSPKAWLSVPGDLVSLGVASLLKARCVACEPGSYCPEGTYVVPEDDPAAMAVLDCPEGSYCASPAERSPCAAGSFCPARSTAPTTCDYPDLLLKPAALSTSAALAVKRQRDVVVRLRDDREPLRGNYCPNKSALPNLRCKPGFYCPNTSLQLPCPGGHYCRAESVEPVACPPLALCPVAASSPHVWPAATAAMAGLALATLLAAGLAACMDRSRQCVRSDTEQDRRARGERALREVVAYFHRRRASPALAWFTSAVEPHDLTMEGLQWRLPGPSGRMVLQGVTGRFLAGHMSAILGPSGCGKTSLLALLAGRHGPGAGCAAGSLLVNGHEVADLRTLQRVTGFVPQDDVLCTDLTVRENLEYSAALRLPRGRLSGILLRMSRLAGIAAASGGGSGESGKGSTTRGSPDQPQQLRPPTPGSSAERRAVVDAVLDMMSLKGLQHDRVGSVEARGISGGQRKRVNIGLELVARPALLFLDEPTSGLDASCCSDVLRSLSDLAATGVNVVAVVHQPRYSTFELFDEVHLLCGTGRTVYHGPPHAAVPYFATQLGYTFPPHENVADTLLDIVAGKRYSESCTAVELPERWEDTGEEWAARRPRQPVTSHGGFGEGVVSAGVAPSHLQNQQQQRGMRRAVRSAGGGAVCANGQADPRTGDGGELQPLSDSESGYDADVAGELADRVGSLGAAAGAGGVVRTRSFLVGSGREAGGAVKQPQLTQEVKEIIEAEYDRLLRAAAAAVADAAAATDRADAGLSTTTSGAVPVVGHGGAGLVAAAAAKLTSRRSLRPRAASEGSGPTARGPRTAGAAAPEGAGSEAKALAPEGLTWSQLLQLFATLGQEGPDAEALVREIMWHAIEFSTAAPTPSGGSVGTASVAQSSWVASTPGGLRSVAAAHSSGGLGPSVPQPSHGGPAAHPSSPQLPLPPPGTFGPVMVRKQQLIRALQWVADGRILAPDQPRPLPPAAMGVAVATGLMTNPMASVASTTLEAVMSVVKLPVRALMRAASNLRQRNSVVGGGRPSDGSRLASTLNSAAVPSGVLIGVNSLALHAFHSTAVPGGGGGDGGATGTGHSGPLGAPRPSSRLMAPVSGLLTAFGFGQDTRRVPAKAPGPGLPPLPPQHHSPGPARGTAAAVAAAAGTSPPRVASPPPPSGSPQLRLGAHLSVGASGQLPLLSQHNSAVDKRLSDDGGHTGGGSLTQIPEAYGVSTTARLTPRNSDGLTRRLGRADSARSIPLGSSAADSCTSPRSPAHAAAATAPGHNGPFSAGPGGVMPPPPPSHWPFSPAGAAASPLPLTGRAPGTHAAKQLNVSSMPGTPLSMLSSRTAPRQSPSPAPPASSSTADGSRRLGIAAATRDADALASPITPFGNASAQVLAAFGGSPSVGTPFGRASAVAAALLAAGSGEGLSTSAPGTPSVAKPTEAPGPPPPPPAVATGPYPPMLPRPGPGRRTALATTVHLAGHNAGADGRLMMPPPPPPMLPPQSPQSPFQPVRVSVDVDPAVPAVVQSPAMPQNLTAVVAKAARAAARSASSTIEKARAGLSRLGDVDDEDLDDNDGLKLPGSDSRMGPDAPGIVRGGGRVASGRPQMERARSRSLCVSPIKSEANGAVSSPGAAWHPAAAVAAAVQASRSYHPAAGDEAQPSSPMADQLNQYFMASADGLARTGSGSFYLSPASSLGAAATTAGTGAGGPPLGPRSSASFNSGTRFMMDQAPPSAPTANVPARAGRWVAGSMPGMALPSARSRLSRVASHLTARRVQGPVEDPGDELPLRTPSNTSRRSASCTGAVSGPAADGAVSAMSSVKNLLRDGTPPVPPLVPSDTTTATAVTAQLYAAAAAAAIGSGAIPEFSGEVAAVHSPAAGMNIPQQVPGGVHGRGTARVQSPPAAGSPQKAGQMTGSFTSAVNATTQHSGGALSAPTPHSFSSLLPWPGWLTQAVTFGRRAFRQASRAFWPATVLEVALLLAAALVVGTNQGTRWGPTSVPGHIIMGQLCLAVLAAVQHLRTFTAPRLVLLRERSAGLSSTAFFVARCVTDLPWILTAPAVFTTVYYVLTAPLASITPYYLVSLGTWWWASGLSYVLTVTPLIPPAAAPTAAVLLALIAGAFLHGNSSPTLASARGNIMSAVLGLSYSRWAVEALTVKELDHHMASHANVIAMMYRDRGTCGMDTVIEDDGDDNHLSGSEAVSFVRLAEDFGPGYCDHYWSLALAALFGLGMALRLLAGLALRYEAALVHRSQELAERLRLRIPAGTASDDVQAPTEACTSLPCDTTSTSSRDRLLPSGNGAGSSRAGWQYPSSDGWWSRLWRAGHDKVLPPLQRTLSDISSSTSRRRQGRSSLNGSVSIEMAQRGHDSRNGQRRTAPGLGVFARDRDAGVANTERDLGRDSVSSGGKSSGLREPLVVTASSQPARSSRLQHRVSSNC